MPVVELRHIKKAFGKRLVLNGMDLSLEKGQTLVIIGCSGIGKSVTLKHIIGLLDPDEGEVLVFGERMSYRPEKIRNRLRLKIGMVFQNGALFDFLTVYDNVGFVLKEKYGWKEDKVKERVMWALDLVGMIGSEDKYPSELSGGMRKRVAIARALVYDPELMLYDEPTAGLDPIRSDMINRLILKLKSMGRSAIVVTHDLNSAYTVADRICMLHNGRFITDGTPEEIRNSDNPIVRQFVEGRAEGPIAL